MFSFKLGVARGGLRDLLGVCEQLQAVDDCQGVEWRLVGERLPHPYKLLEILSAMKHGKT